MNYARTKEKIFEKSLDARENFMREPLRKKFQKDITDLSLMRKW